MVKQDRIIPVVCGYAAFVYLTGWVDYYIRKVSDRVSSVPKHLAESYKRFIYTKYSSKVHPLLTKICYF